MNQNPQENKQPIISQDKPFIVNVKLLTNEVYEITAAPHMLIADLKKNIQQKVKVPVEKQRLVFAGRQLQDAKQLSQYVKQSGLTLHLIAKSQPAPNNPPPPSNPSPPQPQSQPQNQSQSQGQQGQGQGPQLPFNIPNLPGMPNLGNMFSSLFGRPPGQGPQANQEINESLNQVFGNLGGNLQIRMVSRPFGQGNPEQGQGISGSQQIPVPNTGPPNSNQQFNSPPNPQVNQSNTQPTQQSQQGSQSSGHIHSEHFTINQGPLVQLQTTINRLNLPNEQPQLHLTPRDQTVMYLRRLQSEILRFIPHLNRAIQLLQEGRVTHLPELIPIFHSLNFANSGAVDVLQRYFNLHQEHQHHHQQHHHQHHQQQGGGNNTGNQQSPFNPQNNPNQPVPPQNNNQPRPQPFNQQNSTNPFDLLGGLASPNSGFNFANLFAQNRPQPPQPQPNQQQGSGQPQTGRDPRSIPQPEPQNSNSLNNSASGNNSQPVPGGFGQGSGSESDVPRTGNDRRSIPQPEPLNAASLSQQLNSIVLPVGQQGEGSGNQGGGVNLMGLFNSMQQNGGLGSLLSMSLGDMVEEGQMDPVYRDVFKVISGGEIIAIFTQKNFSFLGTKRAEIRNAFLNAQNSAGSREKLIERYSQDLAALLLPEGQIKNKQQCSHRLEKLISRHIKAILGIFLEAGPEVNAEVEALKEMKMLFCLSVEEIAKHADNLQFVFGNIKINTVKLLDKYATGMAGLFYGIVERDLIRIFREYDEEQKRKNEMTEEEAKDEAELLKQIELQSNKDVDFMATFEHSSFYPSRE